MKSSVPQDQPQGVGTLLRRDFTPVAAFRLYRSINSFQNRIKKSDTKSSDKRKAPVDERAGGGGGGGGQSSSSSGVPF